MATPILYTTVEAVQAALGLDEADLPANILTTQTLKTQFMLDMDEWYPGDYVDDWDASIYDPAEDALDQDILSAPSAADKTAMQLSIYSMWFAAYRAIETLLVIPEKVSNGKDEMSRPRTLDLKDMRDVVKGNVATYKRIINDAAAVTSVATPLSPVKSTYSGYNPITGV